MLLAGVAALVHQLIVGLAAMHSGWFPAFAVKGGWLLRREAQPWRPFENAGRQQQYLAQLVGFAVALVTVVLTWRSFFGQGLVPPVAQVYVKTIVAGLADPGVLACSCACCTAGGARPTRTRTSPWSAPAASLAARSPTPLRS